MSFAGPTGSDSNPSSIGWASDTGQVRAENEDHFYVPSPDLRAEVIQTKGYLCLVADGMGGHDKGEVASELAARRIAEEYYADPDPDPEASLRRAIQSANTEIFAAAQADDVKRMGTTVVAAVSLGNRVVVANVGDSRAYLVSQGRAFQITRDHSWVQDRVDAGVLTEEQAHQHVQKNLITRAVGAHATVAVDTFRPAAEPGDWVLLCSDGLSNMVRPEEIARTVAQLPPQAAAQQLVAQANARGGPDNITVVLMPATAGVAVLSTARTRMPPRPMVLSLAAVVLAGTFLLIVSALYGRSQQIQTAIALPTETAVAPSALPTSFPTEAAQPSAPVPLTVFTSTLFTDPPAVSPSATTFSTSPPISSSTPTSAPRTPTPTIRIEPLIGFKGNGQQAPENNWGVAKVVYPHECQATIWCWALITVNPEQGVKPGFAPPQAAWYNNAFRKIQSYNVEMSWHSVISADYPKDDLHGFGVQFTTVDGAQWRFLASMQDVAFQYSFSEITASPSSVTWIPCNECSGWDLYQKQAFTVQYDENGNAEIVLNNRRLGVGTGPTPRVGSAPIKVGLVIFGKPARAQVFSANVAIPQ